MVTQKDETDLELYICEICYVKCSNKSNYKKHLLTSKHVNSYNWLHNSIKNEKRFKCDCGNEYKHRQNLYVHRKRCNKE